MAGVDQEHRFEIKLAFHGVHLGVLRQHIRLDAAGLSEQHPRRRVNNVYLDTPDLRNFRDNRDGLAVRDKIRIRWYGGSDRNVVAAVEIKHRQNLANTKLRQTLPRALDFAGADDWTSLLRLVRADLDVAVLAATGPSWCPTLINRYWREYYATADGVLRVTLDYDQILLSQLEHLRPNLRWQLPPIPVAVVEVKAPLTARERLQDLTSRLPVRVSRNSKYATGIERAL